MPGLFDVFRRSKAKAKHIAVEEIQRDDVIIVLMGLTGAGKSSFISVAGGLEDEAAGVGHGLHSYTKDIKAYQVPGALPDPNKKLVLVDTPGLDPSDTSDAVVLDKVSAWIQSRYRAGIKVAAVLYLHRISDNRVLQAPLRNFRKLRELCQCGSDKVAEKVLLVTTMWDLMKPETVGMERLKELTHSGPWKTMIDEGSEVERFHRDADSAFKVLRRAMDLNREATLVPGPSTTTARGEGGEA